MAHLQQINFCKRVRFGFPAYFKNVRVLDAGSLDLGGTNRYLFEDSEYVGIDLGEGNNVDIVCHMHEHQPAEPYDTIISTEAFEHDKHFRESVRHIVYNMLKSGGLFVMTCGGHGRGEHGTQATDHGSSPYTLDFYQNRGPEDFAEAVDLEATFYRYGFEYNGETRDLYFWGIKRLPGQEQ